MDILAMPLAPTPKKQRSRSVPAKSSRRKSLIRAFESFTTAADSLEKSYGHLQTDVLRLRFELERTNRELKTSLEENATMRVFLTRVVEGLSCGVVVADGRGDLRIMNPEARRLLGAGNDSTKSTPRSFHNVLGPWIEQSRAGQSASEREITVLGEGSPRIVGVACTVLGRVGTEGAAGESVFLLRDITEERRQASEREAMRRKESLAEMAALLAHEIRNPLGSLELFAGLLADSVTTQPDLRRWTDHIQAGLRSLSATVNNVLQFHSQPAPQPVAINVGRLLRETVDFLHPLARQGGLRIDLHNSLGDLEVHADAPRLQQVFFNLALNAFRAMGLGGILTVRMGWPAAERLNEVLIEFEDSGCGITPEYLDKIFEPGFTTRPGNPGLGLAVCKTVIEQHRGNIRVSSYPGRGTTFSVILPRTVIADGGTA